MKKTLLLLIGTLLLFIVVSSCKKTEYNTFAGLYGIVSDSATADPISGATVVLSPGGKTQTTGADGRFEFNDLEARQYTLMVQKTGYQTNYKTITAVPSDKTEVNIPLIKNN